MRPLGAELARTSGMGGASAVAAAAIGDATETTSAGGAL